MMSLRTSRIALRKAFLCTVFFSATIVAQAPIPSAGERALRKQAESGDLEAQERLGVAFAWGRGVERNIEEAKRLLAAPAAAGRPVAQMTLVRLIPSDAPETDFAEAFVLGKSV